MPPLYTCVALTLCVLPVSLNFKCDWTLACRQQAIATSDKRFREALRRVPFVRGVRTESRGFENMQAVGSCQAIRLDHDDSQQRVLSE
ncbi:hypothetical protein A0H81_03105 [Grifola frondosa]|uniref:Secreted protein n=1 Tax=Grifola frondosa TaxID=5627 RepID=A0A1C7MHT9_GRIFR|nr:hypothetical protein A0H81_03105 [Grifola frondosa]